MYHMFPILLHDLFEADVAENEASLSIVLTGNMPGLTTTDLHGLVPGALQLTVGLGVEIEQSKVSLIWKQTFSQLLRDFSEGILK